MVDNQEHHSPSGEFEEATPEEEIHLPGPSFWPLVLAITVTIAVAGLIIHPAVILVGVIAAFGSIIGWVAEGGH